MIPKIQETKASTARPRKTSAKRSFLSFGRRFGGGRPGGDGGMRVGSLGGWPPSAPSPLTLARVGGPSKRGDPAWRLAPLERRRRGRLSLRGIQVHYLAAVVGHLEEAARRR